MMRQLADGVCFAKTSASLAPENSEVCRKRLFRRCNDTELKWRKKTGNVTVFELGHGCQH